MKPHRSVVNHNMRSMHGLMQHCPGRRPTVEDDALNPNPVQGRLLPGAGGTVW